MVGATTAVKNGFSLASKNMLLALVLLGFSVSFNLVAQPLATNAQAILEPFSTPNAAINFATVLPAIPLLLGYFIISTVLNAFTDAGSVAYLSETLSGQKAHISHFFRLGGKFFVKFFTLALVYTLFGVLAVVAVAAPVVVAALIAGNLGASAGAIAGIIIGVGVIAAIAIALWVGYLAIVLFIFAPYDMVLSGSALKASIQNSKVFAKKHLMDILAMTLILLLIGFLFVGVGFLSGFLTGLATGARDANAVPAPIQTALGIVVGFLFIFVNLISKGCFLSYYEGRNKSA